MLYLLLIGIVMLALLDRTFRGGRLNVLKLETKYKLFALRDELREAAIKGEIPNNNWLDYMDTTLTRTIQRIDVVNLWAALVFSVRHRKDEGALERLEHRMKEAFRLEENRKIAEIHRKYRECLSNFLRARHPIVSFTETVVEKVLIKGLEAASGREKEITQTFATAPETSTLVRYGSYTYHNNSHKQSHSGASVAV